MKTKKLKKELKKSLKKSLKRWTRRLVQTEVATANLHVLVASSEMAAFEAQAAAEQAAVQVDPPSPWSPAQDI